MVKKNRKKHVPFRRCISCGKVKPKKTLLRLFVNNSGEVRFDQKMILGGRGAYVCDSKECKKRLERHKKLQKVFRTEYPIKILNQTKGKQDQSFGGVNG
jgi:predicted RNA-binding protein YlxR (DUF448 family)